MLTKIPDYIISECGYPECDVEAQEINLAKIHASLWRNSSIWSSKSTNYVKLLPLRETLTDYYIVRLSKQKESKESHHKVLQNNNKTQQTHRNENELTKAKRNIATR